MSAESAPAKNGIARNLPAAGNFIQWQGRKVKLVLERGIWRARSLTKHLTCDIVTRPSPSPHMTHTSLSSAGFQKQIFIRNPLLALMTILSLASAASSADIPDSKGIYFGVFGGVGSLDEVSMDQVGTVITPHPFPDINVDGRGSADSVVAPIAGVQFGYELKKLDISTSGWSIGMAAEVEGLYLTAEPEGVLDIDPYFLGTQYVSLPLNVGAILVNAVFNIRTPFSEAVTLYGGVGAGYGAVFVGGSNSTNPSEPGINHFNSEPDASSGGLALQAKIGVRAKMSSNWSVFTEFRHIFIGSTDFTFGETDYPGQHLPTTKWNVDLGEQNYNLWVAGLSYHF
jgi:opacity protein-like surface antigen